MRSTIGVVDLGDMVVKRRLEGILNDIIRRHHGRRPRCCYRWIEHKCGVVILPAKAGRPVFGSASLEGGGVECFNLSPILGCERGMLLNGVRVVAIDGNNTPFFFIPVFLVGARTYFLLPLDLFVVQVFACAISFRAHVFFDKEYHVEGSRLQRFARFRRRQELHFVHHRHADSNFAVIDFFWDRILGTYRRPGA